MNVSVTSKCDDMTKVVMRCHFLKNVGFFKSNSDNEVSSSELVFTRRQSKRKRLALEFMFIMHYLLNRKMDCIKVYENQCVTKGRIMKIVFMCLGVLMVICFPVEIMTK